MDTQNFWQKNKVLLTALFMAVLTALAPIIMATESGHYDYKLLIIAAATAAAGFFGNDKRGQGWSMAGQASAALMAFSSAYEGSLDWFRVIAAVAFAWLSIAIPPAKSAGYEKTAIIESAKAEGKQIQKAVEQTPPKQV